MNAHAHIKGAAALLLTAALLVLPAAAAEQGPGQILLSWTQDPETAMTFTWQSGTQQEAAVQVADAARYQAAGFAEAAEYPAVCRDVSLDGSGAWHYEATVSGLEPGAVYFYRAGNGDGWSETGTFTTMSGNETSVAFAYLGDVQPANDTAEEFAQWGKLMESVYANSPDLAFAVLGGDIVNSGISLEQFRMFTQSAAPVFGSIPLFSTVGNHESNFIGGKPELFLDWFAFPENGPEGFQEEFFSFDAANCHVLVLNSWIFSGEQSLTETDYARVNDWIAADLASSTADWQIVVTHIPVYAVHSDATASAVREQWGPIFEQYGVDLVFEGHQHVYSRSYPMYEGKIDYENGITYIMSVSGTKFYDSADETFAARTIYNTAVCQIVRIDGQTMTVQTVDETGNELDFVSIQPRAVSVSRGEYVETLWRAAGSPAPKGNAPFADTTAPAAAWAYESGLIQGCGNGLFDPDTEITAGQIQLIRTRMEERQ